MYSDEEIGELIRCPKAIITREPRTGYLEEDQHRRANLHLRSTPDGAERFEVFFRQHRSFTENFSIGLRYRTGSSLAGTITLVRYNGPHGRDQVARDAHFARPHIHLLTEDELSAGHLQPRVLKREPTDRYETFYEAVRAFLSEIGVTDYDDYFPELLQVRLFDEP